MDNSGDINLDEWDTELQLVGDMIMMLDIALQDTRVGIITYNEDHKNLVYLDQTTTSRELVNFLLSEEKGTGSRNTYKGIRSAVDDVFVSSRGDRAGVADVLVIITLGQPSNDDRIADEIQEAFDRNIDIISIGVESSDIDEDLLISMSTEPQDINANYFFVEDFTVLSETRTDIAFDVASQICVREAAIITTTTTTQRPIVQPSGEYSSSYLQ